VTQFMQKSGLHLLAEGRQVTTGEVPQIVEEQADARQVFRRERLAIHSAAAFKETEQILILVGTGGDVTEFDGARLRGFPQGRWQAAQAFIDDLSCGQ